MLGLEKPILSRQSLNNLNLIPKDFPHVRVNHVELADILMKRKSGWMLTYNDVPQIRKLYKDVTNKFVSIDPTKGYTNVSGTQSSGYKQILVIHK